MATIKSYSDLQQSKKLAEILPLESADMYYDRGGIPNFIDNIVTRESIKTDKYQHLIPCWSLAALLGVLPEKYTELIKEGGMYRILIKDSCMTSLFDNPVDACCVIILKLNELKML